jgi:hypothetical protein
MRPEAKLDSAILKLIQRLEGKIDTLFSNTIGTDTPVLAEPENPIEYTDSVSDIYSHDLATENAGDRRCWKGVWLLALWGWVRDGSWRDLMKVIFIQLSTKKLSIISLMANGLLLQISLFLGVNQDLKFLLLQNCFLQNKKNEPVVAGFQFTKTDRLASQLFAVSQLQALGMAHGQHQKIISDH